MDILVSSNFERRLWFLSFQVYGDGSIEQKWNTAGEKVKGWLEELNFNGCFGVEHRLLEGAKVGFESERVPDDETNISSIHIPL
jgi:threonine synthase